MPTYNRKVRIAEVADFDHEATLAKIVSLLQSCDRLTEKELVQKLTAIVPEYNSSNSMYLKSDQNGDLDSGPQDSVKIEVYPD